MTNDVVVLEDEHMAYDDGTVAAVRILDIPESNDYPDGIKYKFHYGEAGDDTPIIRFDNHHGPHDLHIGSQRLEIMYPGVQKLYRAWREALPEKKQHDW